MKRKKRMQNIASGYVGAGLTLGVGSAISSKLSPGLTGVQAGYSSMARFMPMASSLAMGNLMLDKIRPRKRRKN